MNKKENCKKCNSRLVFGSKYCVNCAEPVPKEIKWRYKVCDECQEKIAKQAIYCDLCCSKVNDTKECPYCAEKIKAKAIKCRFCGEMLDEKPSNSNITIKIEPIEQAREIKKEVPKVEVVSPKIQIPSNFVYVEGGSFMMGSNERDDEKPIHEVRVSSFYIGKYQVTQAEYESVMGNNPSYFKGANLPVESVSFNDAIEFCNKYNKSKGLPNAYGNGNIISWSSYRLPTEAEWEYAARGGNKSRGYKYAGSNNPDEVAWYDKNSGKGLIFKNRQTTHEVGTKKANELEIHDMSGNVWEWCSDWYDSSYYVNSPLNNPYNNNKLSFFRVNRGGSWFNDASCLRVAIRGNYRTASRSASLGFRLVRTVN